MPDLDSKWLPRMPAEHHYSGSWLRQQNAEHNSEKEGIEWNKEKCL